MKVPSLAYSVGCVMCLWVALTLALPLQVPKATEPVEQTELANSKVASAERELADLTKTEQSSQDAPVSDSKDVPAASQEVGAEANTEPEQGELDEDSMVPEGDRPALPLSPGDDTIMQQAQESYYYPDDFSSTQQESYNPSDPLEDIDLSPKAIAEYLIITGDFTGFDTAIEDLLTSGMLSPDEVSQYRDAVSVKYEELLRNMIDAQSTYLQDLAEPLQRNFPSPYENIREPVLPPVELPPVSRNYPQGMMDLGGMDLGEEMRRMQMESALEKEENLGQLLQSLIEDYYTEEEQPIAPEQPEPEVDYSSLMDLVQKALKEEDTEDTPNDVENQTHVEHETPNKAEQELKALEHPLETQEIPSQKTEPNEKAQQTVVEATE